MKHCIPAPALSALLALALCAGPLTVPALAEEASPAPAATPGRRRGSCGGNDARPDADSHPADGGV